MCSSGCSIGAMCPYTDNLHQERSISERNIKDKPNLVILFDFFTDRGIGENAGGVKTDLKTDL